MANLHNTGHNDSTVTNPTHDMETLTTQWSMEIEYSRKQRDQYWQQLKQASTAYAELSDMDSSFEQWMKTQWGVCLNCTEAGMITDEYYIVNENQYLLYLLKFGSPR